MPWSKPRSSLLLDGGRGLRVPALSINWEIVDRLLSSEKGSMLLGPLSVADVAHLKDGHS